MADGIIGPIIVGAGGGGVILSGDPVEEAGEASRRSECVSHVRRNINLQTQISSSIAPDNHVQSVKKRSIDQYSNPYLSTL